MGLISKSLQIVNDNETSENSPTINKILKNGEELDGLDTSLATSNVILNEINKIKSKATDALYVDASAGDDTDGTGSPENPYKTIQKAIDEAVANQTVVINGSEIIQENIVCKEDVNIYAPNTILELGGTNENQLNLARGAFHFKKIRRNSGSNIMITASDSVSSSGYSILIAYEINDQGTGTTIQNGLNRPLDLHIKQVFVSNEGTFLIDTVDATSHTHINFDDLYLSSENCIGIRVENGGNVVGYIQHVKELGTGVGSSTAFDIDDGEINIVAPDCRATTVAEIQTNGSFRFTSQRFSGAINNNGGKYSYFTAGDDNNSMLLSTNLDISLDSDSITLPRQTANEGAFLSIGTNGVINYTTISVPSNEWTDDTESTTSLNTTAETILYDVTVDEDIESGSYQYQVYITPGYYMTTTVRLYKNSISTTPLNTQTSTGAGSQLLSFSLPISTNNNNQLDDGDIVILTIQMDAASASTTIGTEGFLTVTKSGTLLTTWDTINGDPLDNTSLKDLFDNKLSIDGSTQMTGSIDFNNSLKIGPTGNYDFTLRRNNIDILTLLNESTEISTDFLPDTDDTLNLGSTTRKFAEIHSTDIFANDGTFSGDLTIDGDLTVNGTTTTVNTETLEIQDNIILINKIDSADEPYTPLTTLKSGIEIYRGTLTNYQFLFDEDSESFKIGEVDDLQKVATRENSPNDGGFAVWNDTENRFDTQSGINTSDINTPGDLSKDDDTNVTLTLDGNPENSLLNDVTITVGWSGELSTSRGGTGLSSYSQGDILYASDTDILSKLAKSTTSNQYLKNSGTSNNPQWSTISYGDISDTPDTLPPSSHTLSSHSDVSISDGVSIDSLLTFNGNNWVDFAPDYIVDNSTQWDAAYTHSQQTTGSVHGGTLVGMNIFRLDTPTSDGYLFIDDAGTAQIKDNVNLSTDLNLGDLATQDTISDSDFSGVLSTIKGGTGFNSYTEGDILFASSTTSLSKLSGTTTANTYLKYNTGSNEPEWVNINYSDLSGTPTLAAVATSGDYTDLSNIPSLVTTLDGLTDVTLDTLNDGQVLRYDGSDWVNVVLDYSDLSGTPTLAAVATSGDYTDLSGTPTLAAVATSGDYTDLSGTPTLAAVATSGDYTDLSNIPSTFAPSSHNLTSHSDVSISGPSDGEVLRYDGSDWVNVVLDYSDLSGTLTINNNNWSGADLSVSNGGTGTSSLTANKLLVGNDTSAINAETNLHWDNTNNRLGIGTTTPETTLQVTGSFLVNLGSIASANTFTIRDTDIGQDFIDYTSSSPYSLFLGSANIKPIIVNSTLELNAATSKIDFSSSTGNKTISTGGATDLILDPGGNVGIATLTPEAKLDVDGDSIFRDGLLITRNTHSDHITLQRTGTNASIFKIGSWGSGLAIQHKDNLDDDFNTTPAIFFENDNYVGIGTSSPSEKLDVDGSIRLRSNTGTIGDDGTLRYTGSDIVGRIGGSWVSLTTDTNTTYSVGDGISLSGTQFSVSGGNGLVTQTSGLALGTPSTLSYSTSNSVATSSHTHAITTVNAASTNKGILANNGSTAAGGEFWGGTNDTSGYSTRLNYGGFFHTVRFYARSGSGTSSAPNYSFTDDSDTGMYHITTNTLGFSTDGSERMRIASNGNIGIGTSTTSQYVVIDNGSPSWNLGGDSTGVDNIYLHSLRNDGGGNDGDIGASISFSGPDNGGGQGAHRRHAAIAAKQFTSEEDYIGLAFFTHNNTGSPGDMQESMTISHAGNLNIIGDFTGGNGSSGAPTYSFYNDSDTGMYRITTNTLGFSTLGNERMRIASNGNVGIGDTNPNHKLEVNGDISSDGIFVNSGSSSSPSYSFSGNSNTGMYRPSLNELSFSTNGNERMRIDNNGSICINNSDSNIANIILEREEDDLDNTLLIFTRDSGDGKGGVIRFRKTNNPSSSGYSTYIATERPPSPNSSNAELVFGTSEGTDESEKMRLTGPGDLTVVGDVTAFSSSDRRLKENIISINDSLSIIDKLNPVTFNWNETAKKLSKNKDTDNTQYGLIAQEAEKIIPEVVHDMYNGKYKGVDYVKLIPILLASIKELKGEIEKLKKK